MDSFDVNSFDSRMFAAEQFLHDGELIDLLQDTPSPPPSPPQHVPALPPALPALPAPEMPTAARAYSIGLSFQHTIDACLTDMFGGIRNRLTCIETTLSYLRTAVDRPRDTAAHAFEQRMEREAAARLDAFEQRMEREAAARREAFEQGMEREAAAHREEMRAAREAFEQRMEHELRAVRPESPTCVADLDPFADFESKLHSFGAHIQAQQQAQQNTDRVLARLGTRTDELEREVKKKQRT